MEPLIAGDRIREYDIGSYTTPTATYTPPSSVSNRARGMTVIPGTDIVIVGRTTDPKLVAFSLSNPTVQLASANIANRDIVGVAYDTRRNRVLLAADEETGSTARVVIETTYDTTANTFGTRPVERSIGTTGVYSGSVLVSAITYDSTRNRVILSSIRYLLEYTPGSYSTPLYGVSSITAGQNIQGLAYDSERNRVITGESGRFIREYTPGRYGTSRRLSSSGISFTPVAMTYRVAPTGPDNLDLGATAAGGLYLGSNEVDALRLGSTQIF